MNDYKIIGYDEEAIRNMIATAEALKEFQCIRHSYLTELAQLRNKYQMQLMCCVDAINQLKDLK